MTEIADTTLAPSQRTALVTVADYRVFRCQGGWRGRGTATIAPHTMKALITKGLVRTVPGPFQPQAVATAIGETLADRAKAKMEARHG